MNTIKSIENKRAQFAYNSVEAAKNDCAKPSEYKAYVKQLPALIQNNGLGAAIAFVFSKKKAAKDSEKQNAYNLIYTHLGSYLGKDNLAHYLITCDTAELKRIHREILALCVWLKRFADGRIESEEDEKDKKTTDNPSTEM